MHKLQRDESSMLAVKSAEKQFIQSSYGKNYATSYHELESHAKKLDDSYMKFWDDAGDDFKAYLKATIRESEG